MAATSWRAHGRTWRLPATIANLSLAVTVHADQGGQPVDPTGWPAEIAFHPYTVQPAALGATHDAGTATTTSSTGTIDAGTATTTGWAGLHDLGSAALNWSPATWATTPGPGATPTYTAAVILGPAGTQLTPGRWTTWLRVTAPDSQPILAVGAVHIL